MKALHKEKKSSAQLRALPEYSPPAVMILGQNKAAPICADATKVELALIDLLNGDPDLTIQYLQKACEPKELDARAQASRDFLNGGNGPREMFNVFELANFFKANISQRGNYFKDLIDSFSIEERHLKHAVLERFMTFSSIDSWTSIVEAIADKRLIIPHVSSLSAQLVYLGNKGVLPRLEKKPFFLDQKNSLRTIPKNSAVVLDPLLIEILARDKMVLAAFKQKNVEVIVVPGVHFGISAFGTDLDSLHDKFNQLFELAWDAAKKLYPEAKALTTPQVLHGANVVMQEQALANFDEQFGLKYRVLQSTNKSAKSDISRLFVDQVSEQACDPEILRICMELIPGYQTPELRHVLVSLLISQMHIYEQDRFRALLKEADRFLKDSVSEGKEVYLVVPEALKSFGYVSSIYAQFFDFPACNIISLDQLDLHRRKANVKFVIMDDLAGTGGSLVDIHKQLKTKRLEGEVCYMPLIATDVVIEKFEKLLRSQSKYTMAVVDKIESLHNTRFWKNLDGITKDRLTADLGRLGYGHLGLTIVLPHSIPNNVLELLEAGSPLAKLLSLAKKDSSRELRLE
jgi:hypothetical protein